MKFLKHTVVLQEVPNEVSLCFTISGCPLACDGCHSSHTWKASLGKELTSSLFQELLYKYKDLCSCILFMGGEWEELELIKLLKLSKLNNFSTCLYTGLDNVSKDLLDELTYVKLGSWDKTLGGLNSPITNQKFIRVEDNKILNELFLTRN